jgi:NAD(P)-dependent dehydrogenase (short-subunit alcohol dehydrogenase family)
MSGFTDRGVVVTGAARGMGLAIATRFHAEGATVVMFDLDGDELARAAAGLGARAIAVAGDVSRRADVHVAVDACLEAAGHIDVCVAHAGIAAVKPLLELDDETWHHILDVNLTGVFLCTQEAGRPMAARGRGAIVVTSSINGFHVERGMSVYNTSKGGVDAFVRSAAMDLGPLGIRVNAVAPGVVNTRIARFVIEDPVIGPQYLKTIPLGRFGEPPDVAATVRFLASDEAGYITGQTLVVDGGQTLGIALEAEDVEFPGGG